MESLTTRQQQILTFIQQHMQDTGAPPTRIEICTHFGFRSPNAAEDHLRSLERKGVIELMPGSSRGIRLLNLASHTDDGLPLVGKVSAGTPILAAENIESHHPIASHFFYPCADYLLRVQGMSMRDAGILDGDLLAVHRTEVARDGQIVVARIEDEVTVKRLSRDFKRQRILLLPENSDFKPIEVDTESDAFALEGLVVGVLRNNIQ